MKAQMLKMAGVKTEAAFYKKYPTQEAFMKAHGKAFEKAQFGNMFDKGLNVGNRNVPSNLGFTPMSTSLTSSGFETPAGIKNVAKNALTSKLPDGIQSMKVPDSIGGATSKMPGAGQIIGAIGGIAGAAKAFKQQKDKLGKITQEKGVADVSLLAKKSVDVDATRQRQDSAVKAREAIMQPIDAGNIAAVQGTGTNILSRNGMILEDGGEIQNTYDPNDIYDDLGYEPLEDSTQVKQYSRGGFVKAQGGFSSFMGAGGTDFANKMVGNAFGNNAGSQMGQAVGGALKMIPGVGPVAGAIAAPILGAIGGIADNAFGDAGKIKKQQAALDRTMGDIASVDQATDITGGLSAMGVGRNGLQLEDGGYMNPEYNPQVIAKFGDHSPEDVYDFAHEGMNSLRAGGHLKEYRDPSKRAMQTFAMGGDVSNSNLGEVEVESGGYLEPISYNPYNDGTGVTSMIKGQSHDEYNSKLGHSGVILNAYGNQVEAERGEPIREMEEGGSLGNDKSAVITGNLVYKNINNIMNPKYKKYEGKKIKNIHEEIALKDRKLNKLEEKNTNKLVEIDPKTSIDKLEFAALQANDLGYKMQYKNNAKDADYFTNHQTIINNTAEELGVDADSLAKGKVKVAKMGGQFTKAQTGIGVPEYFQKNNPYFTTNPGEVRQSIADSRVDVPEYFKANNPYFAIDAGPTNPQVAIDPQSKEVQSSEEADVESNFDFNKLTPYVNAINDIVPMLRPSDAEPLSTNQLHGEMYALSNNQEEPVQAQMYNPQLANSYRVSLTDKRNDVVAQSRASQRMTNNPAIQAALDAQAYAAYDKIGSEEFRINQELENQVRAGNIATLNDAKLKNLGILDQQYSRQAAAKSNTKAITQAALNSISDKYAKNALENRTLKTYENMYNYRYDADGRLINMNPLAKFDTSGINAKAAGKEIAPEGYEFETVLKKKKATSKNGSIVKAMRNL